MASLSIISMIYHAETFKLLFYGRQDFYYFCYSFHLQKKRKLTDWLVYLLLQDFFTILQLKCQIKKHTKNNVFTVEKDFL